MKFNKIIIFISMLILSLFSINAINLTDATAYYAIDNITGNTFDSSGNSKTLINNGASVTEGRLKQAYEFDGSDIVSFPDTSFNGITEFSYSFWMNTSTASGWVVNFYSDLTLGVLFSGSNLDFYTGFSDGTRQDFTVSGVADGDWHYFTYVFDTNNIYLYVDGSLEDSVSNVKNIKTRNDANNALGGSVTTPQFTGVLDEVSIYAGALSLSQHESLYASNVGFNPYYTSETKVLSFTNITANNITFINNTYYDNGNIDFETTILNTSTNGDVNHSYSINGQAYIQYGTNILIANSSQFFSSQIWNITFKAENNEISVISDTYFFTVDFLYPIINDTLNGTEVNSYTINVTGIECSDTNLEYCNMTIEGVVYDLLTVDEIISTYNGNISYTLSIGDLAGNTNTSNGAIFINPYQYFNFAAAGVPLNNFTFGGVSFNTTPAFFKTYNDGLVLGSNSLNWTKSGFETTSINFTITNTSALNNTYDSSAATIYVNIYDKDTGEYVTGTTTVEFISTIGLIVTSTNGSIIITNSLFEAGIYTIIVTNPAYISENVYFTFTNDQNIFIDVYLTINAEPNAGVIPIKVLDNLGQPVQGASVYAKQWFSNSSSFVTTSQALTDITGKTQLNVLLNDKVYILSASFGGSSVESIQQTFYTSNTETEIVLTLIPDTTANQIYFLYNIIASATESFNEATNVSTISFTWEDVNNEGATGCINTYRSINGKTTLINSDCQTAAATTYIEAYTLNTSHDIVFRAEMKVDGKYYPIASFVHNSKQNPATFLKNIGLDIMIVPLLFLLSVVVALASKNMFIGALLMMMSSGISLVLAPGILTGGVVAFCFVIGGIIMYGGSR